MNAAFKKYANTQNLADPNHNEEALDSSCWSRAISGHTQDALNKVLGHVRNGEPGLA